MTRRLVILFFTGTILFAALLRQTAFPQTTTQKLFLLKDTSRHEWCAYGSESEWTDKVQAVNADVVGMVEFSESKISRVDVTRQDETGDWVVFDHYTVSNDGQIVKLSRTINVLPGDITVDEGYLIEGGKARKQSDTVRRLSTKEALPKGTTLDWLPRVPVTVRIEAFPFASLISANHAPIGKEKACAPAAR